MVNGDEKENLIKRHYLTLAVAAICGASTAFFATAVDERVISLQEARFDRSPLFTQGRSGYSARSSNTGLPADIQIEGLDAATARHVPMTSSGSAEPVYLVWDSREERDELWLVRGSGPQADRQMMKTVPQEAPGGTRWSAIVEFTVNTPDGKPVRCIYDIGLASQKTFLTFRTLDMQQGELVLDDVRRPVVLQRGFLNETYDRGTGGQRGQAPSLFIDLDGNGAIQLGPGVKDGKLVHSESLRPEQPFLLGTQAWEVSEIAADGSQIKLRQSTRQKAAARGFRVPDLILQMMDETRMSIGHPGEEALVLNWGHTACQPCVAEIPALNELVRIYAGRKVRFVAVPINDAETLKTFLGKTEFRYTQALADDAAREVLGPAFPRHLVVDPSGRVVHEQVGGGRAVGQLIAAAIDEALSGPAASIR